MSGGGKEAAAKTREPIVSRALARSRHPVHVRSRKRRGVVPTIGDNCPLSWSRRGGGRGKSAGLRPCAQLKVSATIARVSAPACCALSRAFNTPAPSPQPLCPYRARACRMLREGVSTGPAGEPSLSCGLNRDAFISIGKRGNDDRSRSKLTGNRKILVAREIRGVPAPLRRIVAIMES